MKETFIWDDISQPTYPTEREETQSVKRRQFLQTVGLVGVGLALLPKDTFASVPAQDSEAGRWRDRVTGFVYTVFENDRRAEAINTKLSNASLYYTRYTSDFHSSFLAPYVFSITIGQEVVICGNGFEVDRFPFYALGCPCGSTTDLNAWEIRRIVNVKEIQWYGCVVVPTGKRMPLEYSDHADYRKTVRSYDLNPDDYNAKYKRIFRSKTKGRSYYGYKISHKTQAGANGKPVGDILLSSEDV